MNRRLLCNGYKNSLNENSSYDTKISKQKKEKFFSGLSGLRYEMKITGCRFLMKYKMPHEIKKISKLFKLNIKDF